jgi:hypothetical protein
MIRNLSGFRFPRIRSEALQKGTAYIFQRNITAFAEKQFWENF